MEYDEEQLAKMFCETIKEIQEENKNKESTNERHYCDEYKFEKLRPYGEDVYYGVIMVKQNGDWNNRMIEIWCDDFNYKLFARGCEIVTKSRYNAIMYAEYWSTICGLPVKKEIIDIY